MTKRKEKEVAEKLRDQVRVLVKESRNYWYTQKRAEEMQLAAREVQRKKQENRDRLKRLEKIQKKIETISLETRQDFSLLKSALQDVSSLLDRLDHENEQTRLSLQTIDQELGMLRR